jgi:3-oxoacyl-[acyl-carrier protein] reductase
MTDPAAGRPVALVTGARKGIGRHLAEHLLAGGYRVVGCGRGAAAWDAEGFEYHLVDVTEEAQVLPLFRHIEVTFGRLDALVNNAALATMNHTLLTPVATVDRLMRTNVTGTFLMSREAAKLMRKRRFGRIVNLSSAVVPLRLPGEAAYLASKSAVETLSQVMAKELADLGITVNVVGPGPTATDMTRGVPVGKLDALLRQLAEARFTTMPEIAEAVSWFLQPEHSTVTGQVVYLNGMAGG